MKTATISCQTNGHSKYAQQSISTTCLTTYDQSESSLHVANHPSNLDQSNPHVEPVLPLGPFHSFTHTACRMKPFSLPSASDQLLHAYVLLPCYLRSCFALWSKCTACSCLLYACCIEHIFFSTSEILGRSTGWKRKWKVFG